ncbi:MAG: alpha/beta fold hydrolase, partial [Candidatus Phosphoribacter sp.]
MFDSYDPFEVALPDVVIRGRRTRGPADGLGGVGIQGSLPLVLLHGHPQTHLMWHRIADDLARDVAVVAPDLRGYGASSRPAGGPDHAAYA